MVRRLLANKFVLLGLVAVALAALYGVAGISHPVALATGGPPTPPSRAQVTAAIRACASPGGPGGGGVAVIAAGPDTTGTATTGTPTSAGGSTPAGAAVISPLTAAGSAGSGAALATLSRPGVLTRTPVKVATARSGLKSNGQSTTSGTVPADPSSRGGVIVRAGGAMAAALEVEQTSAAGAPTATCPGPGTDFWFVAPGQRVAADVQLYLMNTDDAPADAEVDIFTDSGPTLGSTDTGISVPAHGLLVQSLAKLLHGSRVVALHVRTSVGRVVAMLRESKTASTPGTWVPASQAPSRSIIVPGLPASAGSRMFYIAVPGPATAEIKLTAITSKGTYQPTGGSGINLPGGSAIAVPVPSLSKVASAIRITSNVPVTASIAVSGGPSGAPGVFTAASAPVLEQGVAADNVSQGADVDLVLSAPAGAVRVRLAEVPGGAKQASTAAAGRVVSIAAKHTVVVRLHRPAGASTQQPFAVVITPLTGSGPLYAGQVTSIDGAVQAILPVPPALTAVQLPATRESVTAAQP
jgi:hypothetical protein